MEHSRSFSEKNKKARSFCNAHNSPPFFPLDKLLKTSLPSNQNQNQTMAHRSHKSRTSKLVCALLFAATLVAGPLAVSADASLPQFPGEGCQSAASAAASSAAFAADNAARSAALLAQNPAGPCSAALAQNAAYAASSAAAAAAAAGESDEKRSRSRFGRSKKKAKRSLAKPRSEFLLLSFVAQKCFK